MIDLPSLSIDPMGVRYGSSKLFQILVPLTSYMVLRDLFLKKLVLRDAVVKKINQIIPENAFFEQFRADLPQIFDQTVGFLSWKVGCDLGFFLIVTGLGPWERAFTWSGLLPYTIIQYFVYFLIGRRMLVDGQLNPFSNSSTTETKTPQPRSWWKQLLSKYLHEDLNTTNEYVPLRQVFLKPFADYGGLVLSWSLYNVGIFFFQSGEMNLAPVIQFTFFQMLTFYLVNTYGYVIGYNVGEWIETGLCALEERLSRWQRNQLGLESYSDGKSTPQVIFHGVLASINSSWQNIKYGYLWRFQTFLGQYGIGRKWIITTVSGVFAVVLIAPSFSGVMFDVGNKVSDLWFDRMGKVDQVQLAQIEPSMSEPINLPSSQVVISQFPEFWQALYIPEKQFENIALDDAPSMEEETQADTKS